MKRGIQLQVLCAFALSLLLSVGLLAQTPIPGYDDGVGGSNYETTAATQVTVGKTIPVYALPDVYYHPGYNPVDGSGITAGFSWSWTPSGAEITLGSASDNYVEVTGATVGGPYTLDVQEVGPFCTGAAQTINVTVLAQPTAAMSQTGTVEDCAGGALPAAAIQTTITDNSGSDYHLVWRLEIYTMSGAIPAADEWFDATLTSLGAVQAFAADYTVDAPDQTATAAGGSFNMTAVVPNATVNSKTTVYSYTLTSINDLVSRRGDFQTVADVNAFTWDEFAYNAIGETLVVTVHPTPTTGPIYHIDNTWAN